MSPTGEIAIPPSERECETQGVCLVNLASLRDAAVILKCCPQCQSSMTMHEECGGRHHGVATYLAFRCTRCTFEHCFCDPKSRASRVLNTRLVLGSRLCGLGKIGAYAMCIMLNLPPPFDQHSYEAASLKFQDALAEMVDEQQKQTAWNLKIALGKNPDDVVDVMVTCDSV